MTNSQRRTANNVASGHSSGVGRVVRGDRPGGGDADMTTEW